MRKETLKYLLSIIISSALFTSCLPEALESDVPQAESKLVISSQVIPNNFMIITVTRSFSALEGSYGQSLDENDLEQYLVKNALVVLTYANRVDTLFSSPDAPGVYLSVFRLEEKNQEFDLYVYDSLSKQSVTSHATMLQKIELEQAIIKAKETETIFDTIYELDVEFTDPVEDNWYVLNVINPKAVQAGITDVFGLSGNSSTYTLLISDKLYNTENIAVSTEIIGFEMPDTAIVMLANISEDYFRYLDARQRGGSILSSLTGEPVNHPSNVQNGYGFFNTYNPVFKQVIIKK